MEKLVTIVEVGAYSERQYQKQDGTTEYFKSRGVTMKRGGDIIYGEMTGDLASKNRDTQYQQGLPYIVKGLWKCAPGATTTIAMKTRSTLLTFKHFEYEDLLSEKETDYLHGGLP